MNPPARLGSVPQCSHTDTSLFPAPQPPEAPGGRGVNWTMGCFCRGENEKLSLCSSRAFRSSYSPRFPWSQYHLLFVQCLAAQRALKGRGKQSCPSIVARWPCPIEELCPRTVWLRLVETSGVTWCHLCSTRPPRAAGPAPSPHLRVMPTISQPVCGHH